MPPPIRYARNGDVNIAFQIVGEGPHDILMIPGWVSHLELDWEEPRWVRWCERMTSFARLVRFDKRGTGMSDRTPGVATPDERMEDAHAVMRAAGISRAHVMGWSEGGPLAVLLAVTHPERVRSLVLYATQATFTRRPDYPFGDVADDRDYDELESAWGDEERIRATFAQDADDELVRRLARYYRAGASPGAAVALARSNAAIDVRGILGSIRTPTLVLSRSRDPVAPAPTGRYLSERIPGARFVELAGGDHIMWFGDAEAVAAEIEHFVTGARAVSPEPGVVRAILLCDIEGSTARARELGDDRWTDMLGEFRRCARLAVAAHGGTIVDAVGDELMAAFEGPVSAIRSARTLQLRANELALHVRAGVHFGEVRTEGDRLSGIAVHIAARVMAEASGDEVLVSETVRDIIAGSTLSFENRGLHELKGVEGARRLFAVA